jgi:hypothetical protein
MAQPPPFGRPGAALRLDLRPGHRPPPEPMVGLATAVSIGASLAVDALLVALGTAVFPAIKGYPHFRFSDYAELTVIGVVVAGLAWPVVTRISAAPRWLFLRLAVLVTLVLWLPDLWLLLLRHQPVRAVAVLMTMHLAIAVVTYNALVRIAPARSGTPTDGTEVLDEGGDTGADRTPGRSAWTVMAVAVGLEFAAGLATLVLVPTDRPSGLLPVKGRVVYDLHGLVGVALLAGAVALSVASRHARRMVRAAAGAGLAGILLAGAGGVLASVHPLRLLGIVLMLAGSMLAGAGYLVGLLEQVPEPEPGH